MNYSRMIGRQGCLGCSRRLFGAINNTWAGAEVKLRGSVYIFEGKKNNI